MRSCFPLRLLAVAMLLAVPAVHAGVPNAANSSLPACMALCPMGDMPFTVVVRDVANNPIAGSLVVLDFSQCPGAFLCPARPADPYLLDVPTRTLRMTTAAAGGVTFLARVGGTGPPGGVRVFADGVLLRSYALASPDQNGNGVCVSIVDVDDAIFAAKLGGADPTADFDCDGDVDVQDQLIFGSHHSHSCDGFVDATHRSSWGQLKLHYH